MDDDGIVGERDDDCNVCDGVTRDPDGDGVDEDLIYIDCADGNNTSNCGSPGNPCKSIEYAWNERSDGPGDGAEDILCFRNVCDTLELAGPKHSGVAGSRKQAPSGNQAYEFQYPTNPTMLVGWDTDNDGRYPPVDKDDVAVLDGGKNRLKMAIRHHHEPSFVEYAHFEVVDYGRYGSATTAGDNAPYGFMQFGGDNNGRDTSTHVYVHDLEMSGINQDRVSWTTHVVFNFFRRNVVLKYIAIENIYLDQVAAYIVRGHGPKNELSEDDAEHFRFQNITAIMHGHDWTDKVVVDGKEEIGKIRSATTGIKLWARINKIEVLDNVFDANLSEWNPIPGNAQVDRSKTNDEGAYPLKGVGIQGCTKGWRIRNNRFIEHSQALKIEPSNGCSMRDTEDIEFSENSISNMIDRPENYIAILSAGDDLKTLKIKDNDVYAPISGAEATGYVNRVCIEVRKQVPGLEVTGNACEGPFPEGVLKCPSDGNGGRKCNGSIEQPSSRVENL